LTHACVTDSIKQDLTYFNIAEKIMMFTTLIFQHKIGHKLCQTNSTQGINTIPRTANQNNL